MRKVPYVNDEYYHIYNRGVEKRKIFISESDYKRFLFILNAFNTTESTENLTRSQQKNERGSTSFRLVEIEEYCLMPNHFHLLLRQLKDGGISKFLQKVITGYTMYFNTKYDRTGVLFQGRHKSKHVDRESYLDWLRLYIHLNPLDLYIKDWKEKGIPKLKINSSIDFLNQYKWVSCDDYKLYKGDIQTWESKPEWQED
jgi:putative transposase